MPKNPPEILEYLNGMTALTATELKYMQIIWQYPEGIMSYDLYERFEQAFGTKTTVIHRILEKGYIETEQRGRHSLYKARISKKEYEQATLQQQLKKTFGINSFQHLIAAFCGRTELTQSEETRIQNLLKDLEENE